MTREWLQNRFNGMHPTTLLLLSYLMAIAAGTLGLISLSRTAIFSLSWGKKRIFLK